MIEKTLNSSVNKYVKNKGTIEKSIKERKNKINYYKKIDSNLISKFDDNDLYLYLKELYAMNSFYNKKYIVDKAIKANGLENIKKYLIELLNSQNTFEYWDKFNKDIKYLGPGVMSELLSYYNNDKFCIWNGCTLQAFKYLGEKNIPNISSKLTGKQYKELIEKCSIIKDRINEESNIEHSVIDVDGYFRFIYHSILELY